MKKIITSKPKKVLATFRFSPSFKAVLKLESKAIGLSQAEFLERIWTRYRQHTRKKTLADRALLLEAAEAYLKKRRLK